jgi:flavodoxin
MKYLFPNSRSGWNMKILVVFNSRTGNTRKVAEELVRILGADLEELLEEKSRKGIIGYIRTGQESMKKEVGSIKPTQKDPSTYDLVILGTPIWAWTMSVPIRTYISLNKDKFRSVAFFCTNDGNKKLTFEEMETACGKKPVSTFELLGKEVKAGNFADKLKSYAEQLKK